MRDRAGRRAVRDRFATLRGTPVPGDRSMPVLSVIMGEAEAMGLCPRGFDSCPGIRRYGHKWRARFLSDEDLRREWNWARGDTDTPRIGARARVSGTAYLPWTVAPSESFAATRPVPHRCSLRARLVRWRRTCGWSLLRRAS